MGLRVLIQKLLVIAILCGFSYYFTKNAIAAWEESPTTTSVSWVPMKKISFPAVTICPIYDGRWVGFNSMMLEKDPGGIEAARTFSKLNRVYRQQIAEGLSRIIFMSTIDFSSKEGQTWMKNLTNLCESDNDIQLLVSYFNQPDLQDRSAANDRVKGFLLDWIQIWVEGKSTAENMKTFLESKGINNSSQTISSCSVIEECLESCFHVVLYQFLLFTMDVGQYLKASYLQRFLVESVTDKTKYRTDWSPEEWDVVAGYVNNMTSLAGIPGPVLYDFLNMGELSKVDPTMQLGALAGLFRKLSINPNIWSTYMKTSKIPKLAINCFRQSHGNFDNVTSCKEFTAEADIMLSKIKAEDLKQFALQTHQPGAHFNPDKNWYNNPLIPFCAFGGPLQWIGEKDYIPDLKIGKRTGNFKWCDIFVKSFPISQNCYTANANKELGHVDSFGTDFGLTVVLENSFGRNGFQDEVNAFNLYLHEQGSLPDYLGLEIQIRLGMKTNITFDASKFEATETLKASSVQVCWWKEQSENKIKLFDKYSQMNCVVELLVEKIIQDCRCLPWDMLDFASETVGINISAPICYHLKRACAEEILRSSLLVNNLTKSCPSACDETQYSLLTAEATNLIDVAQIVSMPALYEYFNLKKVTQYSYAYTWNDKVNGVNVDLLSQVSFGNQPELVMDKRLEDFAVVSMNFKPGRAIIYTTDIKASFSDKLGTIGGTFGIFLGVSFLGIFELLAEIVGLVKDKYFKKKP